MMSRLGVVVIGRNEGPKLRACLESVRHNNVPIVYVDSGSTDGSVGVAASLGARVVELDLSAPFTAARGRNAGFETLCRTDHPPELVQFIDGDCELARGWLEAAASALCQADRLAIVCGRVRERHPKASVFHGYYDLEWAQPPGETTLVGGTFMIRAAALAQVKGFDPTVAAGEEPELCMRLRQQGWTLRRIEREMALHDAGTISFGGWWRREVRTGRGMLDVQTRFGQAGDGPFRHSVRSARIWGLGWPALMIAALVIGWSLLNWTGSLLAATLVALTIPLQIARIARGKQIEGHDLRSSCIYGALVMLAKYAQLVGQYQYVTQTLAERMYQFSKYEARNSKQIQSTKSK